MTENVVQESDMVAADILAQFIEQVERLEEEKAEIMARIRDVYNEAKNAGLEPKVMRQIVRLRKMDRHQVEEEEMLLDLYRRALGMV
ncbi:MAG: DUF2312 domain-containing protein [Magnetococcus sp. WYHC-3]